MILSVVKIGWKIWGLATTCCRGRASGGLWEKINICIYLLFNFEFRAPIKLWIIWSWVISKLHHRPVFWRWQSADNECFSGLPEWLTNRYAMVSLKKLYFHLSQPHFCQIKYAIYSKVCVSLSLSPHLISCIQPFHSSLFFPFLLIVVLLMDEPSVVRSPPFKLGLFLAPHVPGWGSAWKWGPCVSVCRFWQWKNERRLKGCYSFNITVVTGNWD